MRNRFGLKDLVVLVAVLVTLGSVWMSMVQEDRRWKEIDVVGKRVQALEQGQARVQSTLDGAGMGDIGRRLGELESKLSAAMERGVALSAGGGGGGAATGSGRRDESWARPGVPIEWQPPYGFDSDPNKVEGMRRGGTFTEAFNAQPSTIVPLVYKDVYGAYVFERITEYLAEWDPKTLKLRGVLAAAWQYAPDGSWLRVRLRDEARFSDGAPVTADDVIWTYKWAMNPQVQAERSRSLLDFIDDITKVDDKTVEYTFNKVLFTNLSAAMGVFTILPKHFYEKFTPTQYNQATGLVMGSGPFKLAMLDPERQWTPGQDIRLVRNEQYWAAKPVYDELRFKVIRDDLARVTAFNNGECDLTQPSSSQFARLRERPDWTASNDARMWYNIRGGYNFIGWNCGLRNGKPTIFSDKRVRRAMTLLLDRELIKDQLFEGLARVATGPFNQTTAQADPAIKPWPYDLEGARTLLDEAGWTLKPGRDVRTNERGQEMAFEFTYASGSEVTEKLGKYLKDQAAKIGVRVSVRVMDWSVFMQAMDNRDFDAMTMGWSPSSPESDPNQIWHSRFIENQGDNFVQWANAEADQIIEAGRRELNEEARMKQWHRLHAILHDEQPYTFLVERPWLRIVSKRVGNFTEYKNGFQYDELFIRGPGAAPSN